MFENTKKVVSRRVQNNLPLIPGVKNTLAVASGKGGVGKSTVAVNVALALAKEARVGLLDADIYGPSLPWMLGIKESIKPGDQFLPVNRFGVQSISMGNLIQDKIPLIWRGPMASGALQQLCYQTAWDKLDYLVIDLPPGTGDIHLTVAQKIPITGGIIVTTPQDVALLDARRAVEMFNKLSIPVLGIVENMSVHTCTACGHTDAVFGEGGGKRMALELEIPFLGSLPLSRQIQQDMDRGEPTTANRPEGELAKRYSDIAKNILAELEKRPKNHSSQFPRVVVETTSK